MANNLIGSTIFVQGASSTALPWPSGPAKVQSIVFFAVDTTARATFVVAAGSPIQEFSLITHGVTSAGNPAASVVQGTYSVFLGGVGFQAAWIPTMLTACSAWIHFA